MAFAQDVLPHKDNPRLCYHVCPKCGLKISEPFVRGGHLVAFTHRYRGKTCRVVVVAGECAYPIPDHISMDDALDMVQAA